MRTLHFVQLVSAKGNSISTPTLLNHLLSKIPDGEEFDLRITPVLEEDGWEALFTLLGHYLSGRDKSESFFFFTDVDIPTTVEMILTMTCLLRDVNPDLRSTTEVKQVGVMYPVLGRGYKHLMY